MTLHGWDVGNLGNPRPARYLIRNKVVRTCRSSETNGVRILHLAKPLSCVVKKATAFVNVAGITYSSKVHSLVDAPSPPRSQPWELALDRLVAARIVRSIASMLSAACPPLQRNVVHQEAGGGNMGDGSRKPDDSAGR